MRTRIFILLAILFSFSVQSQVLMNKDSLLKLLPAAKEDTNAVYLYINIGQQYEGTDMAIAKYYYLKAGSLSRKIGFPKGTIAFINNYTFTLNSSGLYDSSLYYNLQGVAIARNTNDSLNLGKTLFNTGNSYRQMGDYEHSIQYYLEGKTVLEKIQATELLSKSLDMLQLQYYGLRQFEKGIEYGEKAVAAMRALNDSVWLLITINNLATNYNALRRFDRSASLFNESLQIAIKIGDVRSQAEIYLNLGDVNLQLRNFELMKMYFEKSLAIARSEEMHESEVVGLKGLSFYYLYTKQYPKARAFAEHALAITYQYNLRIERSELFTQLSKIAYAEQNVFLGSDYSLKASQLSDSLLNETIQQTTLDLEKKYETKQKETQIKQLKAEKKVQDLTIRQKNIANYILIAGLLSLLIISMLSYRTYQQRQKLQQQRISELEIEQQLLATEAVLKGEEQERTRLAKDLHDGLGGMLSGIKFSFNNMKGNLVLSPDNAQAFERSMDMLDSSIREMRRVAHNMMPEALVKFGLDTALKDFCNDINQSGALNLTYQSIGLAGEEVNQTTAITIYRIVQELINNTMKHAAAKKAIIQITKSDNQIAITVEDDGKGFDPAIIHQSKGIGWTNIQNRVEFLKGKLDVNAAPGKGTSVLIELTV